MSLSAIRVPRARRCPPALARRAAAAMRRDGAVVLDGLFAPALLRRLAARVLSGHASGALRRQGLVRDVAGRYAAVLPFEGPFLEPALFDPPALRGLLEGLLGPDYRIGSLETVIAEPGAYEQHQHLDGALRFDTALGGKKAPFAGDLSGLPPHAVTLCVPLCEVTEENGPTAIWAGSHREALRAKPSSEAAIRRKYRQERVAGPLGRAFFFDYRVFHCGTANLTREARPVLMLVFCRPWFRDQNLAEVHPRLVISPRALARLTPARRELFALAPSARRPLWRKR
ncbi:MAG TPA: phytanoyl-CoA dioxygenase family protein [Elusimicrobiota bacterium]|nr:phytanoyl-CoA dioxygenase family protein [Elusimicrobiota bacterium]